MIGWILSGLLALLFFTYEVLSKHNLDKKIQYRVKDQYEKELERRKVDIEKAEQQWRQEAEQLNQEQKTQLQAENDRLKNEIKVQMAALDSIQSNLAYNREVYNSQIKLLEESLQQKTSSQEELLKERYEKKHQELQAEYALTVLENQAKIERNNEENEKAAFQSLTEYLDWAFNEKIIAIEEIEQIKEQLNDFRQRRTAVNEAIIREKEIKDKEDFYRVVLNENDLRDMRVLEGIAPQMRNRMIIPRLIWDVIVQRPTIEMIKRITGGRPICGIYKVTYIKTGESYVGQTTDMKTRWQNHIKTAIGLEAAASSTFHSRLAADGIENYTWEILEEVPKDMLREREKYWIEFYGTKEYGLNMKAGG